MKGKEVAMEEEEEEKAKEEVFASNFPIVFVVG